MALDRVRDGEEAAADAAAAKGHDVEDIAYLPRFSTLIERGRTILDAGCGDGLPVDAYLVTHGFAVNGIDASARMIACARTNVPEGFYEVKDLGDLQEGEYCVDGVVSLRALLHIPHNNYRGLLTTFASFMPNGGALLLTMGMGTWRQPGDDTRSFASWPDDDAGENTDLVEDAGFTILLNDTGGPDDAKHQIILARS